MRSGMRQHKEQIGWARSQLAVRYQAMENVRVILRSLARLLKA